MHTEANHVKNLATLLSDIKEDMKEFVQTRLTMLKTELTTNLKNLKVAAPLAAIGLVLLLTAYVLFTLALVGLVVAFIPDNAYRWCIAFAAVAVLWTILGGIAAYFAKREFELRGLMPNKTIGVLKGDKLWIQSEVNSQV